MIQEATDLDEICRIFTSLDQGLYVYEMENPEDDRSLKLVGINPLAEAMTGTLSRDFLGKYIDEAFVGLRELGIPQIYHQLARDRQARDLGEVNYRDNNIEESWFSVRAFPLWERHLGVVFRNITEEKRQRDREGEAQKSLMEAKDRAEEAVRVKSAFLSVLSHEIRTPLNGILGSLELINEGSDEQEKRELLSAMTSSGEILLELVNNVLDLNRLEKNKVELVSEKFDLRSLLEASIHGMRQGLKKDVELYLHVGENFPNHFYGDRVRLSQVINNLLSNAVKFTEKGKVELCVDWKSSAFRELVIEVTDTGIGISDAQVERIFQPFSQADENISVRFGGTGLGLSVSRSIAELMGGRLDARGELGVGSTFTFTMPIEACHGWLASGGTRSCHVCQHNSRGPNYLPTCLEREASWSELNLLLVEDNPINMKIMTKTLRRMGFDDLSLAEDGIKAKEMIEEKRYDIILLDFQLPFRDGDQLIQDVRKSGTNSSTPTFVITANALEEDRQRYLAMGFDEVITKPIQRSTLYKAFQAILPEST